MNLLTLLTVFGLIFVAELPDKSAIASLVMGAKFKASWVFAGVATAFAVHVILAVAAGSVIALLPHRPLEAVVGCLFLIGAVLLWREGAEDEDDVEEYVDELPDTANFWKVSTSAFGVIFLAEWGDLTQILCANLAARYHDPFSVGIGATLGLWAVGLLAILGGRSLLKVLPIKVIVRTASVIMVGLAAYGLYSAATG